MERFKHTESTAEVYNRIIKEYREIDSDSALEALGLEYEDKKGGELGLVLDGLRFMGESVTSSERVANWLKSRGCKVVEGAIEETWKVSLE